MLKIKVYAKINLSLDITGKRADGYHLLDSVFSSVSLYDVITFEKRKDSEVVIEYVDGRKYEKDIAKKAGEIIVKTYGLSGVNVLIEKNIPEKSGVGGSSADAAGVIYGICHLNELDIEDILDEDIMSVGSDVKFMLYGGTRRVFGVGEEISTPIEHKKMDFLLLTDQFGVDTAKSYKTYSYGYNRFNNQKLVKKLLSEDTIGASEYFSNALYDSSSKLNKLIDEKIFLIEKVGGKAFMTGSGSGVVGFFDSEEKAKTAKKELTELNNGKFGVFYLNNTNKGIEILDCEVVYK